ncbi:MAG: Shedu anti-phage system protein SduA domain-containing protein [Thermoplasmata archaeon]
MGKRKHRLPEVFLDNPKYEPVQRSRISLAKNMRWQLTLDRHVEVRTGAEYLRVVRWEGTIQNRRRTWRKGPGFNIRSSRQWDQIRGTVDSEFSDLPAGSGEITVASAVDGHGVDTPTESEDDLRAWEPAPSVSRTVSPAQVIVQHRVEARIPERRLVAFRARRSLYKHQLAEFKGIIADPASREKEVQEYFREKDPFWMFGFQYVAVRPKVTFPPGVGTFEFDLMLKRLDGFQDLVELKGPHERLFTAVGKARRRYRINQGLGHALGQVMSYLEACDRQGDGLLHHPRAIIVIGDEKTDNPSQRRLLMAHLTQVEVTPYSELIRQAEAFIKQLETRGRAPAKREGKRSRPRGRSRKR